MRLSVSHEAAILTFASEPWRAIFTLAAMTGLRPGEVLGLSIDDLYFERRLVFGRRSAWYSHLISPKSARRVAAVPTPEPLAEMHTFRHAHASLLISSGGSPKVAQEQLRHSDPGIKMRAYAHVLGSEQRGAAEKVARILRPDVAKLKRKPVHVN